MSASNYNDTIIFDLGIKFLSGNITFPEQQELQNLLKEEQNKIIFDELKQAWIASGNFAGGNSQANQDLRWEKLKQSLPSQTEDAKNVKTSFLRILRTAAIWAVLVSLGAFTTWLVLKEKKTPVNNYCTVHTPLGSKMRMELQDGTVVWLNAGSNLKYPVNFSDKQRDVYLSGEAFFDVASNKEWPFVVHTNELNVKAVGTSFNVKAYPNEKSVTTTLVEGIVKLENVQKKFSYTLKPKQELVFLKDDVKPDIAKTSKNLDKVAEPALPTSQAENAVIKDEVNTEATISWKDKRWIIQGETIDKLVVMLERRYNIKINILSEELGAFKFSGTIENETIEQVMDYLRYTVPVNYTLNKGYINLRIDNALKEKYKGFLKK
ncbi:MAG TPA: FecR family protein [Bacteroidales bacterium]|nr:FecR family protein [Bacteroidales bacterium]